ncbi:uncharacterized protein (UPF0548 family) [Stackebrandtia albiflava]|uniref:Uncharacterized protein (UPF0548 family) n=1 Tax=Stackebrandtia albiflava TaxID=406432 RepID=A0A562VB69_9ACTN|nr:DUF1990 domain-containing protein [Stackebrandtia albiflava]TWJ15122.1 uncharacterized protein (UPF0548 family) [Stackebrandtia albiflava]
MDYTYTPVGVTRSDRPAPGLRRLSHRARLRGDFEAAAEVVMTWEMHRRAGLRPRADAPRAEPGVSVVCRLGPLRAPCRVVWTVTEPDRIGFGYGTLPGHPEAGEESFTVSRDPDGTVWFTVIAYSRPARWFTRLAGPVVPLAQRLAMYAYARAVETGARAATA